MADRSRTEINTELLEKLRQIAVEEGRSEEEMLEDAVQYFLLGRAYFAIKSSPRRIEELFDSLDAWQRKSGVEALSDEDAMRLAVEEQHAFRRKE